MMEIKKCSKCGNPMKKIPIRRLDSTIIIEFYCDNCDESITFYPNVDKLKVGKPKFF
jgi:hypothetical protein